MMRPRSREGEGPSGLRLERVDLVPTELGVVLVRVSGRWEGSPAPGPVVLHLGERPFEPLPETSTAAARAAAENAFRATFSIGDELRPALDAEEVRLEVGSESFELPVARDATTGVAAPAGGR